MLWYYDCDARIGFHSVPAGEAAAACSCSGGGLTGGSRTWGRLDLGLHPFPTYESKQGICGLSYTDDDETVFFKKIFLLLLLVARDSGVTATLSNTIILL